MRACIWFLPGYYRLCDFGAGDLQVVTYQLCRVYARRNKTVSYASPAYLADHRAMHGKLYCLMLAGALPK